MNFYFKWINKSRSKPELLPTRMKYGWRGYGLYAAVMEVLNEHNGKCHKDVIQFELNLTPDDWEVIKECQAFSFKQDYVQHPDLIESCAETRETRRKRSKSGKIGMEKRWNSQLDFEGMKSEKTENHNSSDITNAITKDNNITVTVKDTDTVRKNTSLNQKADALNSLRANVEIYYNAWMEEKQTPAKFSVAGRKAAKEIAGYLFSIYEPRLKEDFDAIIANAITAWKFILENKERWGNFESTKIRLIDINSNLSNIINNIKNGNKSNSKDRPSANSFGKTAATIKSINDIKNF